MPTALAMTTDADGFAPSLAAVARNVFGPAARIENLTALSGGASQQLWSFDAVDRDGRHGVILRRNPPGIPARDAAIGMTMEAELNRRAYAAGVPVPRVHHVLQPADQLGEGFLMERIAGETIARKILRDAEFATARAVMARQCGEILAKVHTIPAEGLTRLRQTSPLAGLTDARARYLKQGIAKPVLELAFRWLADHMPSNDFVPTVVHGDLRNGNLIVGPEGVRAVLDWEASNIGDPMADLGWLCVSSWRFGEIDKPVGGFGTREDLFAGYEAASGTRVDPQRVLFWEVLGTLRWGLSCTGMGLEFLAGDRSVERAAIGRRACETEIDLLAILLPREGRHA